MNENEFNEEIGIVGEMAIRRRYQRSGWSIASKRDVQKRLESIGMTFSLPELQEYVDDVFWIQDGHTGDVQVEFTQTKTTCYPCPKGTHFNFMMNKKQRKKYIQFNAVIMEHINGFQFLTPLLPPQTKCIFNLVSKKGLFSFDFDDLKHVKINNDGVATLVDSDYNGKWKGIVERSDINMSDRILLIEACKSRESWQRQRDLELNGQGRWC